MPKLLSRLPKYRRHAQRDIAFCVIAGRRVYLPGRVNSNESLDEYRRLCAEWVAANRPATPDPALIDGESLTIVEIMARYKVWAATYYRESDEGLQVEYACEPLRRLYGLTNANEFGPLKLKTIRDEMIRKGLARKPINQRIGRIKRLFRWAAENELVPASVWHGLQTVRGLAFGRSDAKETQPVKPVPKAFVDAVEPFVSRQVWAMIQIQELTAARPGEIMTMRTCDLDTTGRVWIYKPQSHKTAYRGHERQIFIGPKAQEVLRPWLRKNLGEYLFQPREAVEAQRKQRLRNRRTPLSCGNTVGSNRVASPRKTARDRYDAGTYGQAIRRACINAKVPCWSPHRLRHNAATALRKEFGIDVARVVCGHRSPKITEVYAELDCDKAREIMGRVG